TPAEPANDGDQDGAHACASERLGHGRACHRRWQGGGSMGEPGVPPLQVSRTFCPLTARLARGMGVLGYLNGFGGRDMAVDLGTANTPVYVRGGESCSASRRWSRS